MRAKRWAGPSLPAITGLVALVICIAVASFMPRAWRETVRENAFDLVLAATERVHPSTGSDTRVVVIDIDRRSIDAL